MGVHLRAKFEASSIILTSFRRTPKKPTLIRVKKIQKQPPEVFYIKSFS